MADIRINALATTAASTASDDFVAVDGSANGTRKLNAYSPTFGGNLTVSGTGNLGGGTAYTTGLTVKPASDNYQLTLLQSNANSAGWGMFADTSGNLKVSRYAASAYGTAALTFDLNGAATFQSSTTTTVGGNLTVSGTGGVTSSGTVWGFLSNNSIVNGYAFYASGASADQKYWQWQNGSAVGDGTIRLRALNDALTNGTNALIITRTGISSTAVEVGGNLTVSGTGTSSVAGTIDVGTLPTSGRDVPVVAGFYQSSDFVHAVVVGRGGVANPQQLSLGVNQASNYSELQATQAGVATNKLILNRQGGNVLIGTTTDGGQKLQVSGTAAISGGIVGTTTNNSAAAGIVGELIIASDDTGVSLTSATRTNVVSISLTAGDWDVTGYVGYLPSGGASSTYQEGSISATSATIGNAGARTILYTSTTAQIEVPLPTVRVSLSSTTTYYLVTLNTFSGGTMKGSGTIRARRVR